jgi:hypothetical protein
LPLENMALVAGGQIVRTIRRPGFTNQEQAYAA